MINRGKMPRQLRNKGGITNVTPRTNFFLGGIKKRLRKLIPNELSSIAVKAAPFVAPFNPAIAAAMAGIGGFDRTGRIGSSLKSAALTYGGGQLARQLGGADLQGNPFKQGGAFRGGLEGVKSGFSSPLSTGNMEKVFGKASVKGVPDAISGGGTEGILGKLGLTEGAGSLKLTGLGKISAASLASYFVAKGATPDEAQDLAKDVYRGKGIGFDQIRADLEKYKSGEFSQADMFDKNYRFLTPRNFLAKDGGRAKFQTGGVTMANTYAQNIAANQARALANQQLLNQTRAKIGMPAVAAPVVKPDEGTLPPITLPPMLPVEPKPIQPEEPKKVIPVDPGPGGIDRLLPDLYEKIIQPMPPMETDFSKEINWQPGQPAPEGFKVEKMLGDEFLIRDDSQYVPPTEEGSMMPTPLYNEPLPQDQLLSGFEQFKKDNPEVMRGGGTLAIIPATLPGGYDYTFSGSVEANAFRKYLESIGQAPYQGRGQPGDLVKLASGGRTNLQEGSDPGPMGNPAVMKKIENMREERIMNPDVEDVADYLTFYKNKKKQDEEIKRMLKKKKSKKDIFKRDTPLTEDLLGLSEGFTLSPVTLLRRFLAKKELEKKSKKANGGIMSMPTGKMRKNSVGVMERDYRDEGGFVPVGVKEKADDVPAMLSKNEVVFTADAVRGAGNGSIDKGAQKMYNTMKRLEGMVK